MVMRTDRHVRRIRLIALLDGVLVQRRVIMPLEMARASEPLVACRAVVGLWPARLVTLPRLISQRRFRIWLREAAGYGVTGHGLRACDDR